MQADTFVYTDIVNEKMYRWILAIFVLTQYGPVSEAYSPNINIRYSQDSQCTNGLIAEWDSFNISSNFSLSQDWGNVLLLYFESTTQYFEYLVPLKSEDVISPDVSLKIYKHDHTYYIMMTFKANVLLSKAVAFGKLSNRQGHRRFSNNITMPRMYNMSAIRLHVNEKLMSSDTVHDKCTFYVNREKPAIRVCCENAPSPCMVNIYNKGNEVAQGEQCVYVDGPSVKSSNYTFSFTFCGKPETTESYICQALFDSGFPVAVNIFFVTTASLISFIMK